jgi:hypothetical protein
MGTLRSVGQYLESIKILRVGVDPCRLGPTGRGGQTIEGAGERAEAASPRVRPGLVPGRAPVADPGGGGAVAR